MKTELKAKFLQHLNKKRADKGFTLIELLVVIIIIGILAAIALPTFLNQASKGKQSEAKSNVSSINRTQTAFRAEKSAFADTLGQLALGTIKGDGASGTTTYYTYNLSGGTDTTSVTAAPADTSLKAYGGVTVRYVNDASQSVMSSIICEAKAPGSATTDVLQGTYTGGSTGDAPGCGSAAEPVQ